MEFVCRKCYTPSSSLRRCTGCYRVYYCSKTCQVEDWKAGHRKNCKKSNSPEQETSGNGSKHQQGRLTNEASDNIKLENRPRAEPERGPKQKEKTCFVCNKVTHTKTCSRCKKIEYCSEKCQTKDWTRHRQTCSDEYDGHIKTKAFKEAEKMQKIEKTESGIGGYFNHITHDRTFLPFVDLLTTVNDVDLSLRLRASDKQHDKATELAQRFHPSQRIINNLNHIQTEIFGIRPTKSDDVLVGFISRFHDYRQRHCIYIEDKCEQEMYVAFYLDFDNPLPFFSWGDLTLGRFMSIQDPRRHYFRDGSVGIRIDEARNVKIFNVE